jgi:integrase/recombinase XerC
MAFISFLDYLSLEKKYSPHTVTAYKTDLEAFASFCLETYQDNSILQVNYAQIRSWIVSLVDSGLTNRSVNRKIASLKAYYKFQLKIGAIKVNPLAKHQTLKTTTEVALPFSQKEMQEVLSQLEFANDFEGIRDKLIVTLLYTTGMRRAELVNCKVSDINVSSKTIKVLGKRNKERIVPLLNETLEVYYQYMVEREQVENAQSKGYLFLTKSGNKIYPELVYRIINMYFSKASTKAKKSPHILRHTFATHLLANGADLNAVKELLGHASLASTQVYTHNSIAELKKAHTVHPRNKK